MSNTTDFIASIEQRIASLLAAKQSEPINELARWVVLSASDQPLAFDIDTSGWVNNPRGSKIEAATRFNRPTAMVVAHNVKDGNGKPGKAYPLRQAYGVVLAGMEQTLAILKQHEGGSEA